MPPLVEVAATNDGGGSTLGIVLLAAGLVGACVLLGLWSEDKKKRREHAERASSLAEQIAYRKQLAERAAEEREARYGNRHRSERAKYAKQIREQGGWCAEVVCIMPTREIQPGGFWHLAHDHESGGPDDYLGPAHWQCNEYEAQGRGVFWADMEDHDELYMRSLDEQARIRRAEIERIARERDVDPPKSLFDL